MVGHQSGHGVASTDNVVSLYAPFLSSTTVVQAHFKFSTIILLCPNIQLECLWRWTLSTKMGVDHRSIKHALGNDRHTRMRAGCVC